MFLGLTAGAARAQDAPAATTASAVAPRVAYRRAAAPRQAPASVQRVRRRIARIGGGGGNVLRIIYPLVIVPPPPPVVIRQVSPLPDVQRGGAANTGAADDGDFDDGYGGYYYPYGGMYEDDLLPPLIGLDEEDRPPVILFREGEETPPGDTAAVRPPAPPRLTPPPLPGAPPADVPPVTVVRRVERALLNEGLFRTTAVRFEFDQTDILPAFYPTLDAIAEVLNRYPELRIMVAGHTDAIGPEAYNQRLSMARAQAVVEYLVGRGGIDPDRLVARGYGESRPVATNEDVTGRTLNRRVEFRVLNPEAAEPYLDEIEGENGNEGENLREALREVIREEMERMRRDTTGRR